MHSQVQHRFPMDLRIDATEAGPRARRGGSREAIVAASERLFLERGFGAVSMDELAEAGVDCVSLATSDSVSRVCRRSKQVSTSSPLRSDSTKFLSCM